MKGSAAPAVALTGNGDREFEFSDQDFDRVRRLIYQRAGISLSEAKRDMVYSRLARRLRVLGMRRFSEYLQMLQEAGGDDEWEAFTNALTTNLTSFFRESHHFPILAEHVLKNARRPSTIWCCASSTGEEPYSIAMTVVEAFGSFTPPVSIVATDIDTQVLNRAEAGVYPIDRLEKLGSERVRRFFLKGSGARDGHAKVRPELQRLISFRRLNLLDADWFIRGPLDVIFCRNVMIYFDKQTQAKILRRFAPLMREDALLFAGHSESLFHVSDVFQLLGRTVYRLTGAQSAAHG